MVVHVPLNRISVYGLRGEVVDLSCLGMHCGEECWATSGCFRALRPQTTICTYIIVLLEFFAGGKPLRMSQLNQQKNYPFDLTIALKVMCNYQC